MGTYAVWKLRKLSRHVNFTECVCVHFQNFCKGLWNVAYEVITVVSIDCADEPKQD